MHRLTEALLASRIGVRERSIVDNLVVARTRGQKAKGEGTMALIAEIILTVAAWRKGWKGWALLPLLLAGFVGFFGGAVMGAMGYDFISIMPYAIVIDVAAIIALICMAGTPRDKKAPGYFQMLSSAKDAGKQGNVRRALSSYGDE